MAARPKRSDQFPPCVEKTFTLPVAGSTNLHTEGAAAPAGVSYLPSSVMLVVSTAGTFIFKDVDGTSNTLTLPIGVYVPPFVFATIEVGTAVGTATVAWVS